MATPLFTGDVLKNGHVFSVTCSYKEGAWNCLNKPSYFFVLVVAFSWFNLRLLFFTHCSTVVHGTKSFSLGAFNFRFQFDSLCSSFTGVHNVPTKWADEYLEHVR